MDKGIALSKDQQIFYFAGIEERRLYGQAAIALFQELKDTQGAVMTESPSPVDVFSIHETETLGQSLVEVDVDELLTASTETPSGTDFPVFKASHC